MWNRTADQNGRSCYVQRGGAYYVVKIDGAWFVGNLATSGLLTFRDSLDDAKSAAEFMNGGVL